MNNNPFYLEFLTELRNCPTFQNITRNLNEEDYVVAGGALTDLYLGVKTGKEINISDVDIFILRSEATISNAMSQRVFSSYNSMQDKLAKIHQTKRLDKYNTIEIELKHEGKNFILEKGKAAFWVEYISLNFDINICMMHLDFKNNTLVKSEHFKEFEIHGEMTIVGTKDMFNSYSRLIMKASKYKDCGVRFYKDKWLEVLFYYYAGKEMNIVLKERGHSGNESFFNFNKVVDENKMDLVEMFAPHYIVQNHRYYNSVDREIFLGMNWLHVNQNIYKVFNKIQLNLSRVTLFEGIYFHYNSPNQIKIKAMTNIISGDSSKKLNKLTIAFSNLFENEIIFGDKFEEIKNILHNDISLDGLINLLPMFKTHRLVGISTEMLLNGWSVREVISFFSKVNKMENYKNIFIGKIESGFLKSYIVDYKLKNKSNFFKIIFKIFLADRKATDVLLISPIDVSSFKYNSLFREITTRNSLEDEGRFMGHCVGGYDFKVKNNHCRIFHIKHKKYDSTLEIFFDEFNRVIKSRQHYTFSNKKVNRLQKFLERQFIDYLNKEFKYGLGVFSCKEVSFPEGMFPYPIF